MGSIMGLWSQIQHNVEVMNLTIPEDKKKLIAKETKALEEKLVVVEQFKEKVGIIDEFCNRLKDFDGSLKSMESWMMLATQEVDDIKKNAEIELGLLPQGDKVPADAQEFKNELNRITKYIMDLQEKVRKECDAFSEDVKYWAEYKTGIKEFIPWLVSAEQSSTDGLAKPSNLEEAQALSAKVHGVEKACLDHLKVLEAADAAAKKMTTHKDADAEVEGLKARYVKVKAVADTWTSKVDTLVKEWALLDNTVTELNAWVAKDKTSEGENQFSLEKMESTLGELKNIFKEKE